MDDDNLLGSKLTSETKNLEYAVPLSENNC